ncbi:hypothetical protein Q3G72_019021 [Acer saccharum]|nr:hypothetical protein Q3G72_019021 [Acer saccharum]
MRESEKDNAWILIGSRKEVRSGPWNGLVFGGTPIANGILFGGTPIAYVIGDDKEANTKRIAGTYPFALASSPYCCR